MSVKTKKNVLCPICGKGNNCCNSLDKSLGICWCNEKSFPRKIFDLVPEEELRKSCICKTCLETFKEQLQKKRS